MKKLSSFLAVTASIGIFLSLTTIVFAWQKDGGTTCQSVFAKIKNDGDSRYSGSRDGFVKYVRTETDGDGDSAWEWRVGPIEGDVSSNAWVEVTWTPPAGFSGDVEAVTAIYKNQNSQDWNDTGDFLDYKKVTAHLNCPAPSPSPSPSYHPSPSPSPSTSPSPDDECDNDRHRNRDRDDECDDDETGGNPSPSPSPITSPTPSPSSSPSPEISPSPSPSPNDECNGACDNTGGNPSPSPTPLPEASPSPSPSPDVSTAPSSSPTSETKAEEKKDQGGQVLGTSTSNPTVLASTGSSQYFLAYLLGLSLIALGAITLKKTVVR